MGMIPATQVKKINFTGPTKVIGGLESIPSNICMYSARPERRGLLKLHHEVLVIRI